MKTIHKYEMKLYNMTQYVELPENAVVLSVGVQRNKPVIWAMVNHGAPMEQRKFWLLETGAMFENTPGRFIGTIQLNDEANPYVLHLFEEVR